MTTETTYPAIALEWAFEYNHDGYGPWEAAHLALQECVREGLILMILDGMVLQLHNAMYAQQG